MKKRFLCSAFLGIALCAAPALAGLAQAQQVPEAECDDISVVNEALIAGAGSCLKSTIDYQSLISISDAVRKVVAGRLAQGGEVAEPAGLAMDRPHEIAARLAGNGTLTVEPAADLPAAATAKKLWNVWIDGKYSWIE